jgi:hypothetical protein
MKNLRVSKIFFEGEVPFGKLREFRAALSSHVRDRVLFHHHLDDNRFVYRYPLIQYKQVKGQIAMICLEHGIEDFVHFLDRQPEEVNLNGYKLPLKIARVQMRYHNLHIDEDKRYIYRLSRWVGLNRNNHDDYHAATDDATRYRLLERMLTGNILSFAKGVQWAIDEAVQVEIQHIERTKKRYYKKQAYYTFDLIFSSNVFLPHYIGLGRHASVGFGVVSAYKLAEKEMHQKHSVNSRQEKDS